MPIDTKEQISPELLLRTSPAWRVAELAAQYDKEVRIEQNEIKKANKALQGQHARLFIHPTKPMKQHQANNHQHQPKTNKCKRHI